MISTETPYKLADIIRDTWPGIYIYSFNMNNNKNKQNYERLLDCNKK